MTDADRRKPNIIVTGSPGVGKSTHCEQIAKETGLRHLSINDVVKDKSCHEGYDEELKSYIVDEDKLLDALEDIVPSGGYLIDWHACDLFPERWIDLVVVLRTDNTILYDRLTARKYPEAKLQENIDAEIMEVLLSEARESYAAEIVVELHSNTTEDIDANVERVVAWTTQWTADHSKG